MRLSALAVNLFFFYSATIFAQCTTQSLNSNWKFSEAQKNNWMPATVPGTVHTDLLANGKIPDPFIGDNENKVQWVETKTWEYKTAFDCDKELWKQKNKELDFEGLDTYADVYLNDSLLFTAEDMFLSYSKNVNHILKKKNNILKIIFHPASELIAKNKSLSDVDHLPGGDRVYIRKAQYQFGWDFGPRLVTCGIWKNVKLLGWSHNFIRDADFSTDWIDGDSASIKYSIVLEKFRNNRFSLSIADDSTTYETNEIIDELVSGRTIIEGHFTIHHPRLWWCNGKGKPKMYKMKIKLTSGKHEDEYNETFGVRTIELVTKNENFQDDFRFLLNGVPIFIKGANWIPCDNFIPRVTRTKYSYLLKTAKNSNMNMLRVWGGGIYEQDVFYDLCDSLGIMVWQDFPFACGMYPGSLHFYNVVRDEAADNISRLANHPCLSLWCGNNENMEGWMNWDWQKDFTSAEKKTIEKNYRELFNDSIGLLKVMLGRETSDNFPYLPGSPEFGWGHDEAYKKGDVHYWGVWWGMKPFSAYDSHVGRFMTEYGFQGMPALSTFKLFNGGKNYLENEFDTCAHQKNEKGAATIDWYMQLAYPVPKNFEDYIYVSQVMQADAMTRAINDHRAVLPYCMGTLFWQYNDCWPGITWSSIDYYGEKKIIDYKLKELYAPESVIICKKGDSLCVNMVSDEEEDKATMIRCEWKSLDGKLLEQPEEWQEEFINHSSKQVKYYPMSYLTAKLDLSNAYLEVTCRNNTDTICSAIYFVAADKSLRLAKDPGLAWALKTENGKQYLEFTANSVAKNVYLTFDSSAIVIDNNGFDVLPGEPKRVEIHTTFSEEELRKRIKIQMMNNLGN
ncbi:MAG: glycoside hydrolase family 2 protein [Bacteroidetes bacterium]|nr:glycoside hydrolase family 2 protein [Bacteroidota bacterium]